jgi:hypothetical protein
MLRDEWVVADCWWLSWRNTGVSPLHSAVRCFGRDDVSLGWVWHLCETYISEPRRGPGDRGCSSIPPTSQKRDVTPPINIAGDPGCGAPVRGWDVWFIPTHAAIVLRHEWGTLTFVVVVANSRFLHSAALRSE